MKNHIPYVLVSVSVASVIIATIALGGVAAIGSTAGRANNGSSTTFSINAEINGSSVSTYGSSLRVSVTALNNGSVAIEIPVLYRIVQNVVVLNSTGSIIGGTAEVPFAPEANAGQMVSLAPGASLTGTFTIVFLSAKNPVTPNLPVTEEGPTSINAFGAAYLQNTQSYSIRVNAVYPNGEAVPFVFPLVDEVPE